MSHNAGSPSGEASGSSSGNRPDGQLQALQAVSNNSSGQQQPAPAVKRKRNLPGTPDPDAEVIALSPRTLLATNRFVCEICSKGFQRDQNLQLHRRGHNLPWKLRQRTSTEIRKRVYICPEPNCVHHDPARALGDLTGIKKHFCRKHGDKKWKCDKCSKRYAVQSDWKAHLKTCGTREYRCDCGTLFSRRDSFITHRAFCDALAEENARVSAHRQGGSIEQHGVGSDNGSAPANAGPPLSPHQADSQLSEDPNEAPPSSSEISRPGLCDGMSNFPLTESGIASLPSKWVQGPGTSVTAPNKGPPGLSLFLGSGPGPPGCMPMMGGRMMPTSSRAVNEVTGSSEEYDTHNRLPSGMMPLSTSGAGGMFTNLFMSGNGYSGSQGSGISQNTSAGMPGFAAVMTNLDRGRYAGGPMPGLGTLGTSSVPSASSSFSPPQHTASAQMSATALLQKAAQMGATASNQFLFRGFGSGVGGNDPSSMAPAEGGARPSSRQDQGRLRVANIFSSSLPPYQPVTRQVGDMPSSSQGARYSPSSMGQGRGNEVSSVQEFMNALSGGGLFGGAPSSLLGPSTNGVKGYMQHADSFLKHHVLGETTPDPQTDVLPGKPPFQLGSSQAGFRRLQRGEDGADRTTLDFLGVGRTSGMAGATTGMGRTLSQKDLASLTSLSSGVTQDTFPYQKAACNQ